MNPSTHLRTIRRGSRFLAWFCLAAAVAWPLVSTGYVLVGKEAELHSLFGVEPPVGASVVLGTGQRLLAAALNLVPRLAASVGLWALYRCFRLFSAGEYFSVRTVRWLRRFSGWTFCHMALAVLFQPLIMLVLTMGFPAGQHQALISFGPAQFYPLLIAGTVWVIAGAMTEASRLADENAQFI
jgi:hypothetical protein